MKLRWKKTMAGASAAFARHGFYAEDANGNITYSSIDRETKVPFFVPIQGGRKGADAHNEAMLKSSKGSV